jgi:hypothetical protein
MWRHTVVAKIPNAFFKVWTPDMAYVLGYWWADGAMLRTPQSCRVTFTSKDGEHLQRIAHTLGMGKVVSTNNACYRLTLYRKSMYDDLLELGGIPNKSLTATWHAPPHEYLCHFVRGYIDGDRSLFWLRTAITTHPRIQAVGTKDFLTGMASAIEQETGIPIPTSFANENIWRTTWSGMYAKCLASWLYEDASLCLERKHKIALEFLEWQPKLYRRSHITTQMRKLFEHLLPEQSLTQSMDL